MKKRVISFILVISMLASLATLVCVKAAEQIEPDKNDSNSSILPSISSGSTVPKAYRRAFKLFKKKGTLHGIKFKTVFTQYKSESGSIRCLKLQYTRKGKTTVVSKLVGRDFLTNGNIIYYQRATPYSGVATIHKFNLLTKENTKSNLGGEMYELLAARGKWLYVGIGGIGDEYYEDGNVYAISSDFKKENKMFESFVPGVKVFTTSSKVIANTDYKDTSQDNPDILLFDLDGTPKGKVQSGKLLKVLKGEIYFSYFNPAIGEKGKVKVFKCDIDGENEIALTKWIAPKKIPKKYKE